MLLDLDSQGHATQHMGYQGEECERTLYDVLVHRLPIEEAIVDTPLEEVILFGEEVTDEMPVAIPPAGPDDHAYESALQM